MTEFDDINLPADFDDLSKHAPLLDKLRAKGDGFVVPGNYFSEAFDFTTVIAQLSLLNRQQAGFVVPENYFEELAERIISIAQLHGIKNENAFSVPNGYFEKLTDEILAIAQLSSLKNTESFEIPEGYFAELDESLNTNIALDNLKQDEGFEVPEGYFEKLSGKILSRVAVDELNQGSSADVPQGYFDTLADKIAARIAAEESTFAKATAGENIQNEKNIERGRVIVFAEVLKRYARPISIAASVTLLIGVSIWFFTHNNNGKTDHVIVNNNIKPKQIIQPIIAPIQKHDSVIIPKPDNIAVVKTPKHKLNHSHDQVVKQLDKKDIMEQLDLLDENMVAEYVSDKNPEIKIVSQEEYLNNEMLNYILDNNTDASDINK